MHYHPPEWNGTPQDASFQADLFALGLTFCEAVLGSDANPRRREGNNNFSRTDRNRLLAQLAEHGISRRVRRVVAKLLEPAPQARPASAVDVLELWRRQNNPSLRGLLSWGIAAVLLMLLILAWSGWGVESLAVAELSERVQKKDDDIAKLVKERDDYKSQLDQMTGISTSLARIKQRADEIHALISKLPPPDPPPDPTTGGDANGQPPPSALDRAKMRWQDSYSSLSSPRSASALALCELQIQAIENLFKQPPSDLSPDERRLLKNGLNELKSVRITRGAVAWAWYDEKFQDLLQKAVKQPWGEGPGASNVKLAQDRLNVVKDAYKKWLVWAANSEMTWDDLRSEIQAAPADQRDLLAQWRDDVMKRTNVEMQLVSGKSDDWGTTQRNVYVYGSTMKPSGWHQWAANTSHTYPSTGKAPDTVAFQWQPGEPLRIVLKAGRSWYGIGIYNPNLIDHTFKGPLALWQANRIGQIQSGNRLLKFEIKNCPGPPFPKRP